MTEYFYTEKEEKRLLDIIDELENNSYMQAFHFVMGSIEDKIDDRFRAIELAKLCEVELDYAKNFRHEHLKLNYGGYDIPTALAEMLLIAEKQGYEYSIADETTTGFSREQGFLNHMLKADEENISALESTARFDEKLHDALLKKIRKGHVIRPIAELRKEGKAVYLLYDINRAELLFVKENSPDALSFQTHHLFVSHSSYVQRKDISDYLE
jgi:hypothetical protein